MGFIVLGLDPGLAHTGWGVVEVVGGSLKELGNATINTDKNPQLKVGEDTRRRVDYIMGKLEELVELYTPYYIALEEFTYYSGARGGKPQRQSMAGMQCSRACGAIQQLARMKSIPTSEMQSRDIKTAVVGYWKNVEKLHVKNSVRLHLKMSKNPKSAHSADALAAAITMAGDMNLARKAKGTS